MAIYMWFLKNQTQKEKLSIEQDLWNRFYQKMEKRGLSLSKSSLRDSERILRESSHKDAKDLWWELVASSFKGAQVSKSNLLKKIKKL